MYIFTLVNATLNYALYGKYSKILNTFLFLLSDKIWVIRAGIHKMLVRIANREDCGVIRLLLQKQSDQGLCLFRPFWQVTNVKNFRT